MNDETPHALHNGWGALFEDEEDDLDYDPASTATGYESDRLSDESDWDPVPLEDDREQAPIQVRNTKAMRERLGSADKLERVLKILHYMDSLDMNLPIFLDALSWGDNGCIAHPKVQYERTGLMVSEELPRILERWYRVPKSSTARTHNVRPNGARKALEKFAMDVAAEVFDRELESTAHLFRSPKDGLSESALTGFDFAEVTTQLQDPRSGAPHLCALLQGAMERRCRSGKQKKREQSRKNPIHGTVMLVSQLQYQRSHSLTRWVKPLTVFLKSKGLSAKGLDLLHALGITMSHSWTVRALGRISDKAMEDLQKVIHLLAWWLAYDNVNFAFQVYSQRLGNQSHFDSGTSGSVFVKPNAPPPPPLSSAALQEQRKYGRQHPITMGEIVALEQAAAPRIRAHLIHLILKVLLDCPEFDFSTYEQREHSAFAAPPPVDRLPYGPEHITKQYVLGTVHIDEASYEGTRDLVEEWMRQVKLHITDERIRTGMERVLIWIGDQLTADRLRGFANMRCEDINGYDRLDWLVVVFGWFHLLMAFANSLHRQYFGSASGRGLRQAFALLHRKGLQSIQIKGTFFHHLHEGILHVSEARLRTCWRKVGGVESLKDLRTRSPDELKTLAEKLLDEFASNDAIEDLDNVMEDQRDEVYAQGIMWNRDVLYYILLHNAMRTGDVGMMEDLLPHLLYRFAGGGNHKYAVEVLELLQGLHREWTPEVKEFVRKNCWLVNLKGGPEDFSAIDLVQEHTIKDVKVTYRPKGPNASWNLMNKRAPAIPTLRAIDEEITAQFRTIYRGASHTDPSKEADVQLLDSFYREAELFEFKTGREAADNVKEVVSDGYQIAAAKILPKWIARRSVYERARSQTWTKQEPAAPVEEPTVGV